MTTLLKLNVFKTSDFRGDVDMQSLLNVGKKATFSEELEVVGASILKNTLSVAENATLSKSLEVVGSSVLKGAAECQSTLTVAGAATMSDTLDVASHATIGQSLTVAGAATMSDTLDVAGILSAKGVVDMTGGDAVNAGLIVQHKARMGDVDVKGDFKYLVGSDSKLSMMNDAFTSELAYNNFRYGTAQKSLTIDDGARARGITPTDTIEISTAGLKIKRRLLPHGNLVEADRSTVGAEHVTLFGAPTKQSAVVTTDAISLFKDDSKDTVAEFTPDSIAFKAPLSAQKISCMNLDVAGTMTTKHQEEVFIGDSHMVLNAGSETTGQMHGGLVTVYDVSHALAQKGVNFTDATSCTTTSTEQDFKDAALPGMILQISGSAENDGLYLIESNIGGSIKCFAAFDGIGEKMPFIKMAAFVPNAPNAHDEGTMLSLVSVNSLLVHGGGGHSASEEVSGHGAHGSGLMYMCSGGHRDDFFLDGEIAPSKAWKYQRIGADRTYENKTNSLDIYADVTNLSFATDADIPALTTANDGTQVAMTDSGRLDFPSNIMDRSNNRLVWLPPDAKAGTSYKISSSADDTVYITSSDFVDAEGNYNILTGINDGDDATEMWTNNITLEQYGSICITKTQPGVWQVL